MKNYLKKTFELDTRSLALMRILIALVIIFDLVLRLSDLNAFYTDWGTLPRWTAIQKFLHPFNLSFHLITGNSIFQSIIFVAHGLIAMCLLFGLKTRLMTVLCWIFAISLQNRNVYILHSGDVVLRVLLFWSMFLHLGLKYSFESALSNKKIKSISNMATVGFVIQLLCIYFFSVFQKTHPNWTSTGLALEQAFNLEMYTNSRGIWLLNFPTLLRALTFATIFLEFAGPLLFFLPFKRDFFRGFGVFCFIFFHLGIILTMDVGIFPYVCMAFWTALIPSCFWDSFKQNPKRQVTIFFDKDCNFCKKMSLFIRTFLLIPHAQIENSQSNTRAKEILVKYHSWSVQVDSNFYFRFEAFCKLLNEGYLKFFARFLSLTVPSKLGDWSYKFVSNNRDKFAKLTKYFSFRDLDYRLGIPFNILATLLLIHIIFINIYTIPNFRKKIKYPKLLRNLNRVIRLDQKWSMFAPFPLRDDGWYVILGETKSGEQVSLWTTNRENLFDKPKSVSNSFINERWKKYLENIWQKKYAKHRLYFGKYLCRTYNKNRSEEDLLQTFEISFLLEKTNLKKEDKTNRIKKVDIWTHNCFLAD